MESHLASVPRYYVVKVEGGYLGRQSISDPLGTVRAAFASVFQPDQREVAERLASVHGGTLEAR